MADQSSQSRSKRESSRVLNRLLRTNRLNAMVPGMMRDQWDVIRLSIITMLLLCLGVSAYWLVFKSPELYVTTVEHIHRQQLPLKEYLDAVNTMRATTLSLLSGIGLFFGAYLTLRNVSAAEKNVKLAQEGQITDRFSKAVEQLGSEKLAMRLGGIYALERIAKDSERDHWSVMEILTAFVRENSPLDSATKSALLSSATGDGSSHVPKVSEDIHAIMTVIRRRNWQAEASNQRMDLSNSYLSGVDLSNAYLKRAKFTGSFLGKATLSRADFEAAELQHCDLSNANLQFAFLQDADIEHGVLIETDLHHATLSHAQLTSARLERCDMGEVKMEEACFNKASIIGTDIGHSDLRYANFRQAELTDVSFHKSHLEWAKFTGATLTDTDLSVACCEGVDLAEFTAVAQESQENIKPAVIDCSTIATQPSAQIQILRK